MNPITFKARWREELEAISTEGRLVFEFTVGQRHVYFPDQARWRVLAPGWARDKWQDYHDACGRWCMENRIPMTLKGDAHFHEEKQVD